MNPRAWCLLLALAACSARGADAPDARVVQVPDVPARQLPSTKVTLALDGAPARALSPGEHVQIAAGARAQLDVGLAVRLSVTGPAVLASDPEGERRAYLQGGRALLAVSADSAARPFAFELATACGVLHVQRAAQADIDLRAGEDCLYALEAGTATLTPPSDGGDLAHSLAAGAALRCASASACVTVGRAALDEARQAVSPASGEATPYRRWLGEQLERASREVSRLRAAERVARSAGKPEAGGREALALQRKLALGAADALRARAHLRQVLAAYRATGLANTPEFSADTRDTAASAALRRDP